MPVPAIGRATRALRSSVRTKILALLLAFGLAPALVIAGVLKVEETNIQGQVIRQYGTTANGLMDTIDRIIFERYGDVQAFALNVAARDPANWRHPETSNPLVAAMNGYTTGYVIYKLMLVVGTSGEVLAANSVRPDGKPLDTRAFYGRNVSDASWFKAALAGKFLEGKNGFTGTVVEGPAVNEMVGKLYGEDGYGMVFAAPIKNARGETVAVWANFADFGFVESILADTYTAMARDGEKSVELTILDSQGRLLVDLDPAAHGATHTRNLDILGKLNLAEQGVEAAKRAIAGGHGTIIATHARKKIDQASGYAHSQGTGDFPGLGWSVLVRAPTAEAFAQWNQIALLVAIAILLSAIATIVLGWLIGRAGAKPITAMTDAMGALAAGDKSVAIPATERSDELGAMAKAVQVFKDNAIRMDAMEAERKAADAAQAKERSEAQARAQTERKRSMMDLADRLESAVMGVVQSVSTASSQMQSTATSMSHAADETSRQSTTVAAASEEATTNVQTAAAAAEELTASISEINRQVSQSSGVALKAVEKAKSTNATVKSLAEVAQKVGEVVSLISSIASQTNLLALNATIEAARAGEAGKGFAVVASEVKMLANQTAKATEDISAQIAAIQGATDSAVKAIEDIGTTIAEISEISTTIASAVEEQGAATHKIVHNVQQAATGTKDVTSHIGGVSQSASQVGESAGEVRDAASAMAEQSKTLKAEVERFLAEVRAA